MRLLKTKAFHCKKPNKNDSEKININSLIVLKHFERNVMRGALAALTSHDNPFDRDGAA